MTDNMRPNPINLWNAYKIPRGTSTVGMKGGKVRLGNGFDLLTGDEFSVASELDRRAVRTVLPENFLGMFREILQAQA